MVIAISFTFDTSNQSANVKIVTCGNNKAIFYSAKCRQFSCIVNHCMNKLNRNKFVPRQ